MRIKGIYPRLEQACQKLGSAMSMHIHSFNLEPIQTKNGTMWKVEAELSNWDTESNSNK
jgi:hypothetical protein